MNAFGGMFAAAGYHAAVQADPYGRMAAGVHAGLQDPTATAAAALMHHHHHAAAGVHPAAHMHGIHAHHQYKVPRIFYKIPRVLPYKDHKVSLAPTGRQKDLTFNYITTHSDHLKTAVKAIITDDLGHIKNNNLDTNLLLSATFNF